jgi:hypothetical protein
LRVAGTGYRVLAGSYCSLVEAGSSVETVEFGRIVDEDFLA